MIVFAIASLLVTSHQYIGDPIDCIKAARKATKGPLLPAPGADSDEPSMTTLRI